MATTAGQLERVWAPRTSLAAVFATVDHKAIGVRYIITGFIFFALAGIQALLMRVQLAVPNNTFLNPQLYNQLFTMHGTTMIFFFATPILFGFGNYFVPLLIGARDMAFPRLNSFGYWVYLLSGVFMYVSFLLDAVPDGGWFNYVPLTGPAYSPTFNIDFYALGILFLGISTTAGAINFIVTIFKMRAPGMSINRMPLFIWAILATSFAVVFAYPPLNVANVFLELDRKIGTDFFNPAAGGQPLLWQHLFWFFGHPDVYIIFLPAVGMISEMLPTFARRSIVGYIFLALSAVGIAIISFGVWVHHMFAVGLPPLSYSFFSVASLIITIPSGIQFFSWIATIWMGKPVWKTPLLFILGFMVIFLIGGLSGVMFAVVPFDQQITDSYFVVAHFHYVLIGGMVFPLFGAFYYWLPKITGRMMSEGLGRWNFWVMFVGFNLAFFPMHISGLLGMPRRYYTYADIANWDITNMLSTIGAFVFAFGILLFVINWLWSLWRGAPAGDNPWGANTLEWATTSPPPPYNFRAIPIVRSRDPLWDEPSLGRAVRGDLMAPAAATRVEAEPAESGTAEPGAARMAIVHTLTDPFKRETLGTTLLDAEPESILHMPEDSYWPLILAIGLAVGFAGALATQIWTLLAGVLIGLIAFAAWIWPREEAHDER